MDTTFMNSENSKTSKSYLLTSKVTDKLDLRLDKKVVAISNLKHLLYMEKYKRHIQ